MRKQAVGINISILALAVLMAGCATLETTSYRVLGVTAAAVDVAMNSWGDNVRAGLASDPQQAQVRDIYGKYQKAMEGASIAVHAYYDRKAQAEAAGLPPPEFASVQTLIDALSANSDAIMDLIISLLPPDKAAKVKVAKVTKNKNRRVVP